ncbi:hypothetical protein [Streptomyces sp. NPDC046909]|uniref:hypothetical protein n=1 Tax=Streptomyces sp. NPDC046909 TaxID=3155617 RepID=UPI0033C7B141
MYEGPGARLSLRDRLVLKHIETEMRRDRRVGAARVRGRDPWLPLAVALFGAASVFLMVVGTRTSDPGVLWAFAVLWPVTLLQAFRLLCRWSGPHAGR